MLLQSLESTKRKLKEIHSTKMKIDVRRESIPDQSMFKYPEEISFKIWNRMLKTIKCTNFEVTLFCTPHSLCDWGQTYAHTKIEHFTIALEAEGVFKVAIWGPYPSEILSRHSSWRSRNFSSRTQHNTYRTSHHPHEQNMFGSLVLVETLC